MNADLKQQFIERANRYETDRFRNRFEESGAELLRLIQTSECEEILKASVDGDELSRAFVRTGDNGSIDLMRGFLVKGMDVSTKTNRSYSALVYACDNGHEDCVRLLLDHNADVLIQNCEGNTPLMLACRSNRTKIVQWLLERNAEVNVQNKNGWTALMYVSQNVSDESEKIVQMLLDNFVDETLVNRGGKTALDVAKTETVKEMLQGYMGVGYILK